MNLSHYSPEPIESLKPYPSETWGSRDNPHSIGDKPLGLWISDDSQELNWKSWCEGEEWGLDTLKYRYILSLKKDSNVLILSGTESILAFHNKYKALISPSLTSFVMIDWKRVSSEYQGIVITPYIWELRLDRRCRWYYGWDCASGCIWDIDSIAEFRLEG